VKKLGQSPALGKYWKELADWLDAKRQHPSAVIIGAQIRLRKSGEEYSHWLVGTGVSGEYLNVIDSDAAERRTKIARFDSTTAETFLGGKRYWLYPSKTYFIAAVPATDKP
jgi:hypothetical protein